MVCHDLNADSWGTGLLIIATFSFCQGEYKFAAKTILQTCNANED